MLLERNEMETSHTTNTLNPPNPIRGNRAPPHERAEQRHCATGAQIQPGVCECPCRRKIRRFVTLSSNRALAFAKSCTTCWHQRTTDRRLAQPTQPTVLWLGGPSSSGQSAFLQFGCNNWQNCTIHMGGTRMSRSVAFVLEERGWHPPQSCTPREEGKSSAMISNLCPPVATSTARSKSLNNSLVATLAFPSRHRRVAAFSMANPRLPRAPALAHAAR